MERSTDIICVYAQKILITNFHVDSVLQQYFVVVYSFKEVVCVYYFVLHKRGSTRHIKVVSTIYTSLY